MKDGYIQQVGAPKEIYDFPNNMFVAGFIGTPPMNFLEGVVNNDGWFITGNQKLEVPKGKLEIIKQNSFYGKPIVLGIRPEDIHDDKLVFETFPNSILKIEVDVAELLGAETNIYTNVNGNNICASVDARADIHIGDKMELALDMNKCHFFNPETEQRLVFDQNK
jgi:multiple sugar transport system ATP-binding protein